MDDFYQDMQGIATSLLKEFNQGAIEYVELTAGTGPRDNPGAPSEVAYPVDGVARGVQQRYVDGTNIVQTDMQATLAVKEGLTPSMSGFVRGDGMRYKIVGVRQIPPFGTPVAHVVIFRK